MQGCQPRGSIPENTSVVTLFPGDLTHHGHSPIYGVIVYWGPQ